MTNEPDDIQNLFNILESHENKLDNLENVIKKDKLMINDLNSFSDEINLLKNELKNIKEINNKTKEYLLLEIESSVDKQNQFNQSNYFGDFVDFLKKCPIRNLICMYGTGARIKNDLNDCGKNIYYFDSLREAVNLAKQITTPGTICLLSPAASSKDYFVDYQEKGKLFVCLVKGENTDITERK